MISSFRSVSVSGFQSVLPRFCSSQADTLDWLAWAHEQPRSAIERFVCQPPAIMSRYHEPDDFLHRDSHRSGLARKAGFGMAERMAIYRRSMERVFAILYPDSPDRAPADAIIHVSCTGYDSPSAVQRLIDSKNWGKRCSAFHAYHMGCYAAFPALRMAAGLSGKVDVVHTELCTLHFNASLNDPEQFVVQSLFADGFIRYAVTPMSTDEPRAGAGFRLLSVADEIIPGTSEAMSWSLADDGMRMTLARAVPKSIIGNLPGFLDRLSAKWDDPGVIWAVHPGGPRILDEVQKLLGLDDGQMDSSRRVLRERGNMSSATIPHIWKNIAEDPRVPAGNRVVSLAFGPGLTICGSVMEKL